MHSLIFGWHKKKQLLRAIFFLYILTFGFGECLDLPNFLGIKPRPSRTAFILLELCYGFYIQFNNVNAGI
jgi:hypothetical protein